MKLLMIMSPTLKIQIKKFIQYLAKKKKYKSKLIFNFKALSYRRLKFQQ